MTLAMLLKTPLLFTNKLISCSVKIMDQFVRQEGLATTAVETALKLEKDPLFTQNTHYLESCRDKWLWHYKSVRNNTGKYLSKPPAEEVEGLEYVPMYDTNRVSRQTIGQSPTDRALLALAELGYKNLAASDLARLNTAPDNFQEELMVMADVRAYFQVAYKVRPQSDHEVMLYSHLCSLVLLSASLITSRLRSSML